MNSLKNAKEDIHYKEVLQLAETNDVTNTPPVTNEGTAEEIVDNSVGDYEDADWEEEEVLDTDFSDEEDSMYEDDFMEDDDEFEEDENWEEEYDFSDDFDQEDIEFLEGLGGPEDEYEEEYEEDYETEEGLYDVTELDGDTIDEYDKYDESYLQDRLDDVYDEYNQIFNKEPSDIINDSMTTQEKIDKIVEAIQEGDNGV